MSRRQHLVDLRHSTPVVLPSLLLCDFGNLEREISSLEQAGVRGLHLDVMDGQFVPNLTYGMPIVEAVRRLTSLPIDVHLMIFEPEQYVEQFVSAGADIVTFHVEATDSPRELLGRIRDLGVGAGLALNPDTPVEAVEPLLDLCDLVLVMAVNAGFGGQAFNPIALAKLTHLKEMARPETLFEIDGGVNGGTIADCAQAGAQLLVVGSAIFKHEAYGPIVEELTCLAASPS